MQSDKQEEPAFDLEAAVDQAITACDGDARAAIGALIVANNYLSKELEYAWHQVSPGFSRGKRTRRRSTGAAD